MSHDQAPFSRSQKILTGALLLSLLAFGAVLWIRVANPAWGIARPQLRKQRTGDELLMVVLVSSQCPQCNDPAFRGVLEDVRNALRTKADSSKAGFVTVGVAVQQTSDIGLKYLKRLGPWDEVNVGEGWLSLGASKFIWSDLVGPPTVPQIVVVSRHVDLASETISIRDERVLERIVGLKPMQTWLHANAPSRQLSS